MKITRIIFSIILLLVSVILFVADTFVIESVNIDPFFQYITATLLTFLAFLTISDL